MVFEMHFPPQPLSLFVESFFYFKDQQPLHSMERFLPDGNVYLVIDLTDEPKFIFDNETLVEKQACKKLWFSGIRTQYITIPSGRDSEMFVINFHKGRAFPFTGMPLNELSDRVVDGELVMSPEILNLRDALLNITDIQKKFHFAAGFLTRVFGHRMVVNPFVDFAVKSILERPDLASIDAISGKVGFSQKHLIKLFKEHVGVTPKSFLQVVRFQKAIQDIETAKTADWKAIAHDCGYYDQAHFINDFARFSGYRPKEYLAQRSDFMNYIAVD